MIETNGRARIPGGKAWAGLAALVWAGLGGVAHAQSDEPIVDVTPVIDAIANPPQPTAEQRAAHAELMAFDTQAYTFPEAKRADLSQCDNADAAGMLRAVRECWPVYRFYEESADYRQARRAYQALASDPSASFDAVDEAERRMVAAAFRLRDISRDARYPAQFEISVPAHLNRFFALSHDRHFEEALADVEEQIAAQHASKRYRETGTHNVFLHYSRSEMTAAIAATVGDAMLDREELARPVTPSDVRDLNLAFHSVEQGGFLQLGVDPQRAMRPGDCDGTDYRGLLRAIRYCREAFDLYRRADSASLYQWRLELSEQARIENERLMEQARRSDLPASDFFEFIALMQASVAAYFSGDEAAGASSLSAARALLQRTPVQFAPEMTDLLEEVETQAAEYRRVVAAKDKAG